MTDPYAILRAQLVEAAGRVAAEPVTPAHTSPRRWRRGRRRPLAVILVALVVCGSATAAVLSLGGSASQRLTGRVPGQPVASPPAAALRSVSGERYRITVFPGLTAGGAGWLAGMAFSRNGPPGSGGQAGGLFPTAHRPIFGGTGLGFIPVGVDPSASLAFSLTGPEVAAIRYDGRIIRTATSAELPAGDRMAVFFLPARAPVPVVSGSFEQIRGGAVRLPAGPGRSTLRVRAAALVPLDASGRVIRTGPMSGDEMPSVSTAFWQAPAATPKSPGSGHNGGHTVPGPAACELGQSGLPGLTPVWGHTVARVSPVTAAQGELLLSCVDTHYDLHGWPLTAAVLVNAQHPGATPGPLPGATPVPHAAGMVDVPGARLSGRRVGSAWLVVSGGSGTAQRLRVLAALRISHLDLTP